MRRSWMPLLALLLVCLPLAARLGTIDLTPAATLLVPYWEADPFDPDGVDTLVTIQNASATATIAHVTLWTDYGLPTTTFDFYLTGYDQETFSLRGVMNRFVPLTADAGDDPTDEISNKGPLSQDINFPGIRLLPETCTPPNLHLAHMGVSTPEYFGGLCGAKSYADGIARGYLTVDTVNQWNSDNPTGPAYAVSVLTFQNILTGQVTFVDRPNERIFTEPAVHIESKLSSDYAGTFPAGTLTFYGRFVALTAADQREALPTAWVGAWAGGRTAIEYWRDPGVAVSPFPCGNSAFALDEKQVRAYNAAGSTVATAGGNPFPLAAGVTSGPSLGLNSGFGSLFLNLNLPVPSGPQNDIRQSWITMRNVPRDQPAGSPMGYAAQGVQLGNAMTADNPVKP